MATSNRPLAPTFAAGALGGVTVAVIRRMEAEYANDDTLSGFAVAGMYATYAAHVVAFTWAATHRVWPVALPTRSSRVIGTVMAVTGSGTALAGARPFGGGAQLSGTEPGDLHATGIYRYSRNPQYLGLGVAATGVALAVRSAFAGLFAAGVWLAYRRWIPSEEQHLARMFGDRYVTYKAGVRRWLGTRTRDRHTALR